jgi:hypothetical protein
MTIEQTDQRLFKGTTAEILAFVPPAFTGWTYAESTDDHSAYRWNVTTVRWESLSSGNADVIIYCDTVTGNDANPGSAILPVQTFAGIASLLPKSHKGLCRCYVTGPSLVVPVSGVFFPPHPEGLNAEPFTMIGAFVDSGLGERTSTGVTTLAGGAGVTITDSALAIAVNAYQMYRLRVTTGSATGRVGIVRSNTIGGDFSVMIPSLIGFVGGVDKFVIEQPATTTPVQAGGFDPSKGLYIHGPDAFAIYGIRWLCNYTLFNTARVAAENSWLAGCYMRFGANLWMGNIRSTYNSGGVGSRYGNTLLDSIDGACAIALQGATFNIQRSFVAGSFVVADSVPIGPPIFQIGIGSAVHIFASWNGRYLSSLSSLVLAGPMRHTASKVQGSVGPVALVNVDISNGAGVTASTGCLLLCNGLIGSSNSGVAIAVDTGSAAILDSATTITGSIPGTNDIAIGVFGNFSHAALTAALAINDSASPGGTGAYAARR